jgi:spore coat protein CotH
LRIAGAGALVLAACGGNETSVPGEIDHAVETELGPESSSDERAALQVFDDTRVHTAALAMTAEDWRSILDDSRGDEWRHAAFFLDGIVVADVGVRPSGESSRMPGNPKMSMNIKLDAFSAGKTLGGYDTIKLSGSSDDPFVIRDRIAYWYMRQLMPAPREVAAELTVNGEGRGAYQIEERWDAASLAGHFASPLGPCYRLRGVGGSDPYAHVGDDPIAYVPAPWDPVGNPMNDDHSVVPRALRALGEGPAGMEGAFDMERLLSYFASDVMVANTDGFTGEFEIDDHFQYFDPGTGKLSPLPWDPDNTFGSINDPPDRDIFHNFDKSALSRPLRDGPLRERYLQRLETYMSQVPLATLDAEIDRVYAQVYDSVARDTFRRFPTGQFEWSRDYVKDFMAARYASVAAQIADRRGGTAP